jgi:hypothetical protein
VIPLGKAGWARLIAHMEKERVDAKFWLEDLKDGDQKEILDVNGKIIQKRF